MEVTRLIKKYPNRRLYDTTSSRYITLEEIKNLVLKKIVFQVVDDHAIDVTDHVLLQLLTQEENLRQRLLTRQSLKNLLCFYDHPAQRSLSEFLEIGLSVFADQAPIPVTECNATLTQNADKRRQLMIWQGVINQILDQNSEC